jgi:hypothetical protein
MDIEVLTLPEETAYDDQVDVDEDDESSRPTTTTRKAVYGRTFACSPRAC